MVRTAGGWSGLQGDRTAGGWLGMRVGLVRTGLEEDMRDYVHGDGSKLLLLY